MEIKNVIKRELSLTIIETIIVLIIIIFIALELGKYFLRNNLTKTVKVDNLIVELNPIIDTKLSSLTDYEGLNLKGNNITITNNNDITKFVENFNLVKFRCNKIEYHKKSGRVSKLYFEEILE